jgi:hypothetical protein
VRIDGDVDLLRERDEPRRRTEGRIDRRVERRGPAGPTVAVVRCSWRAVSRCSKFDFSVIEGVTASVWLVWNASTHHVVHCFRHH